MNTDAYGALLRRRGRATALLLAGSLAAACQAEGVPKSIDESVDEASDPPAITAHTATYELLRSGSAMGRVEVSLSETDEGLWLYRMETVATAFTARMLGLGAKESSLFSWDGERLVPHQYRNTLSRPGRNRYWNHDFDWTDGVSMTRTYEGDYRIALEEGVLDPLLLRLATSLTLASRDTPEAVSHYLVLERDEVEAQEYRHIGSEALEIEAGCFDTLKMERFRSEGSSRNYTAWHSAAFQWMPVRIHQSEDNLDIRLVTTDLPLDGADCD